MKLTVQVPDDLHHAVKAAAAARGDTMTGIVIEAFHRYLREAEVWTRWEELLEQARRLREVQQVRRGIWQGPDIATVIAEGRTHRTEHLTHVLGRR